MQSLHKIYILIKKINFIIYFYNYLFLDLSLQHVRFMGGEHVDCELYFYMNSIEDPK
jgi:hypothetical protein